MKIWGLKMKGYRSIDGDCVIKAKLILSSIIDVWIHAFTVADELDKVEFKQGLYYKVRNVTIKEGLRLYRYKLLVVDDNNNLYNIIYQLF